MDSLPLLAMMERKLTIRVGQKQTFIELVDSIESAFKISTVEIPDDILKLAWCSYGDCSTKKELGGAL